MGLPEPDVARIEKYCKDASSPEHADIARIECEVRAGTVTIVEATRMSPERGGDWLRVPAARLRFNAAAGAWTLYCFDHDSRAVRYDLWDPDFVQPGTVEGILDEIEADPTDIFWG